MLTTHFFFREFKYGACFLYFVAPKRAVLFIQRPAKRRVSSLLFGGCSFLDRFFHCGSVPGVCLQPPWTLMWTLWMKTYWLTIASYLTTIIRKSSLRSSRFLSESAGGANTKSGRGEGWGRKGNLPHPSLQAEKPHRSLYLRATSSVWDFWTLIGSQFGGSLTCRLVLMSVHTFPKLWACSQLQARTLMSAVSLTRVIVWEGDYSDVCLAYKRLVFHATLCLILLQYLHTRHGCSRYHSELSKVWCHK